MDTWSLLVKELNYHGIRLIDSKKCQVYDDVSSGLNAAPKTQGVIRTLRETTRLAQKQKKLLLSLWKEIIEILGYQSSAIEIVDEKMSNLFVFALKDLAKFLLCFEGGEKTKYHKAVSYALARDIKTFSKQQIYTITDYKISIDWINRTICRLLYVSKLLAFASIGRKRIAKHDIKTARGISGPWAHLDLPMEERVFPFGDRLYDRMKAKQEQNRYTKGLQNYNNDGRVGEGHYWRELRNEPYSWFDREEDSPYPSRTLLTR